MACESQLAHSIHACMYNLIINLSHYDTCNQFVEVNCSNYLLKPTSCVKFKNLKIVAFGIAIVGTRVKIMTLECLSDHGKVDKPRSCHFTCDGIEEMVTQTVMQCRVSS